MDRSPRDHTSTEPPSTEPPSTEPPSDLTLHDAAALYAVSARTLATHIRCGQLPAYKTAGAHGRQWRVAHDALHAAGYPARVPPTATDAPEHHLVTQLRRELSAARSTAAAERRRADDTDRRLGHAMLECGRLRTALARATGQECVEPEPELDSNAARWLVAAARGGSPSGAALSARAHSD